MSSLLVLTQKFMENNGWVRNIYCGLTTIWAYCRVCKKYSHQTPWQYKGVAGNEQYVCSECKSSSILVG